ncbi:MAG TPA: hypothetical protein VFF72_10315 [Caldimonas sp.]|nr:hypothetical protein [Caldimonas sp.]
MTTHRHRPVSQRRFAWLFWLALVLPLAQSAASWHAFSHLREAPPVDADAGKHALHAAHCGLCLMAAAIAGGAPPAEPPVVAQGPIRHATPASRIVAALHLVAPDAYLSRAPPLVSL